MDDNVSYKLRKEASVTGHSGTFWGEIIIHSLMLPITSFLHYTVLDIFKSSSRWSQFFIEFMCRVIPILLINTILSDYSTLFFISIALFCNLHFLFSRPQILSKEKLEELSSKYKPFIDDYRSSLMIATCVAILAVDFPKVFPRRFVKCETFGHSIMDQGVGAFVFSSAVVSSSAKNTSTSISKILRVCAPMIIFGFIRFVLVILTNYQHHVSEYGVHWNFYFTLAAVSLFVNIISLLGISGKGNDMMIGLFFAILQQILLNFGLQDYILNDERGNFISQNKEGIFTLFGYLAIYFIAVSFGKMFHEAKNRREWKSVVVHSWIFTLIWFIIFQIWEYNFKSSRRLMNFGYISLTIFGNMLVLSFLITIHVFSKSYKSLLANAISRNSLAFFLLANLLTGIINLSIKTLDTEVLQSMIILISYLLIICIVFVFFIKRKIIKL